MTAERTHDIVLFGATGFTGALVAEYLAAHAPPATRWALAGRNRGKLEALRSRLAATDPAMAELELLAADAADPASLRAVAESARVVITTVGPYLKYGEGLVAACAAAGTDYVDLTGEPEFVDEMYVRHHATALASGARLVHACGFDSIPHDLGAYFTVGRLPADVPVKMRGYVRVSGTFSGGTFHSAVNSFGRLRQASSAHGARRRLERPPPGRRVRALAEPPHRAPGMSAWALPLPTIDPQVVVRSAAALERYGPDFSYGHYMAIRRLPVALGLVGGVGGLLALSQLPPARRALLALRPSGAGPSPDQRRRGWFKVRFVADGGGRRVVCEVAGGDPGYGETSKMLAEAALCLAGDELPALAGQLTTAVAMGDALTERLRRASITFTLLSDEPARG